MAGAGGEGEVVDGGDRAVAFGELLYFDHVWHARSGRLGETAARSPDLVAAEVAGHLHRAGRDDLAGPRWQRAARHARSLGAMPEAARFWAEAVRCDPEAVGPRLELAEAFGWLGQDADFEREWQAALQRLPAEGQSVAWNRRGKVLGLIICNLRAGLAAYQQAVELLPADAPRLLRVEILIGAAWCESVAGDPARGAALLDQAASLVADPDDTIVAEMAHAKVASLARQGRFSECEAVAGRGGAAARRAGRPDLAFSIWLVTACALSVAGDMAGALRAADAAVAATRGIPVIEVRCLAGRAFVLSRLGRHDEALSLAAEQLAKAERMDSPAAAALARHDAGLISLAAGHYAEAARMLAEALAEGAEVSRPAARLARAEALARSGRPDDAAAELRQAALEPVRDADLPWALVPRMARVQGLIALARGDHALARRRLGEAADSWRRHLRHDAGTEFMATVVDLARPPIVGLVEPEWELRLAHHRTGRAGQADGGVLMPGFELNADCRAPVEEVWKLLFDPDRFPDWWAGIEAVRKDAPGQFTLWPAGDPDFPLPQTLRADQADGRVIISCQVFAIDMVWQLAEAGAGTSIHVNVTAPESQARRLDGKHQLLEESLRRLTALAEAAS